jgi:hypothetical protein
MLSRTHIPPETWLRVVTRLFRLTEISRGPYAYIRNHEIGAVQRRHMKSTRLLRLTETSCVPRLLSGLGNQT